MASVLIRVSSSKRKRQPIVASVGLFAIHRTLGDPESFTVTHKPTGCATVTNARSKRGAMKIARLLDQSGLNWRFKNWRHCNKGKRGEWIQKKGLIYMSTARAHGL